MAVRAINTATKIYFGIVIALLSSACVSFNDQTNKAKAWPWLDPFIETAAVANTQSAKPQFTVQYIGAGGAYLEYNQQGFLVDPFFSNPSMFDLATFKALRAKKSVIDKYLPDLTYLKAIAIGHGHYDHLMDVPYIASLVDTEVKVFGSETAVNQIASQVSKNRLVNVLPKAFDPDNVGAADLDDHWIYINDQLRVMPIKAAHAPHIAGYLFAADKVTQPQSALPGSGLAWQCGETLAYLIEWLVDGKAAFKVVYASSSAGAPRGIPPMAYLENNAPMDIALLATVNFQSVAQYPSGILQAVKPKHIMMIHWEKFWQPYRPGEEEAYRETELDAFLEQAKTHAPQAVVYLPRRTAKLALPVELAK